MSQQVNVYRELKFFKQSSTESARMVAGSSSAAIPYTAGTPSIALYYTSSNTTSTNAEPFYMKSVMTGAGGVGGRARFHLYTNAALGGWANALKAFTEYGDSGKTTGLGSALCAELQLSAGTTTGTYAALEAELVAPDGAKTGTHTNFIFCNGAGDDVATTIDTSAYFVEFGSGLTAGSGKFIDTAKTTHSGYGGIRIYVPGVGTKWLAVVSD